MVKALIIAGSIAAAVAGCRDFDKTIELPDLDRNYYRCNVEPVLEARCAFPMCHGDARRPLRIYARNRLRFREPEPTDLPDGPPLIDRNFALTAEETQLNFDMARAFALEGEDAALLVRKPLDIEDGGSFHRARDLFGGVDVFASQDDLGYQVVRDWVADAVHPPDTCTVSEEVGP